jgi:hypothetical protein
LLSDTHAALGKLPTATAGAAAEKHLTLATHQDDADVRAKPVRIYNVTHIRAAPNFPAGRSDPLHLAALRAEGRGV